MNILPKKRWHVRTKENIARVRRDEALAAEQAKIEQARIEKAESEAKINFLRNESRKKSNISPFDVINNEKTKSIASTSTVPSKHINFFEELEQGNIDHSRPNKDYERDKKEEQEKYEKQIGYLTYLGQGLQEAVKKSWYNEMPKRFNEVDKNIEVKPNKKAMEDPMQDIKRYLNIISLQQSSKKSDIKLESRKRNLDLKNEKYKTSKKRKRKSSADDNSSEDNHRSHKKRKKHKKHKKSKKHKRDKEKRTVESNVDIEKLRAERLKREENERLRVQELLEELKSNHLDGPDDKSSQTVFRQKYNSQFFPELARQNCEKNYK